MPELLDNRVNGLITFPDLTIAGLDLVALRFQVVTGFEINNVNSVRDRDVGAVFDHEIPNLPTVTDGTMSRTWREERDAPLVAALKQYVGRVYANVAKVRRDTALNQVGADRFNRCLLNGISTPDGDTASTGNKTMLVLRLGGGIPN